MSVTHSLIEFVEFVIFKKKQLLFLWLFCCEAHCDFLQTTFMKAQRDEFQFVYGLKLLSSFFPGAVSRQVGNVLCLCKDSHSSYLLPSRSRKSPWFPSGRVLGCCYDEQVPTV